jgi:glycosyltransferase involved in cell wall biosynthesis
MKISVVVSVLDEEDILEECLSRLIAQERPADEIIIVDNGSTDGSLEIAGRFPVRLISETRRGIWAARATGYDAATGDIIVCCDADSYVPPGWLGVIEERFRNDLSLVGLSGPGEFYDTTKIGAVFGRYAYMKAYFFFVGLGLGHDTLFGSNFAMRRKAWHQIRGEVCSESERFFDDIDTAIHLGPIGKIAYEPAMAVGISFRPLRSPVGMVKRYIKAFRTIFGHWPKYGPWKFMFRR